MSGNIFFTSDTHYYHSNVIRYCNRPFSDVEEMNDNLIANHNELVGRYDTVFHLGDFAFARGAEVFRRLNGNKFLIRGNHDKPKLINGIPFGWVKDVYMLKISPTERIWLSHYAHRRWPNSHHGAIHLFGHSHGAIDDYGRSTDVGVDCWNFKPVALDEIRDYMKNKEPTKHHEP